MQYSMVALAALVAGASAGHNVSFTTEVVDSFTTFCPFATHLTHSEKVYTVTEATLLTITNCPCTLTKPVVPVTTAPAKSATPVVVPTSTEVKPVVTSVAPVVSSSVAPVVKVTSVAPPVVSKPSVAPPIFVNTTTPVVAPVAPTTAAPQTFKGAANSLAASGFSLAGVLAIAAYLL